MTQLSSPFWAFDRKQDYRHLLNEIDDLLVLTWDNLKLNPLKPPEGVDPDRWADIFSIIFSQNFDLLSGSRGFLTAAVSHLYTEYELYRDCSPPYPSLFELTNLIRSDYIDVGPSSVNYKDTTLWRLHPRILISGKIFDCSEGYGVEQLLERNVVFEIGGRNRNLQRFLQQIQFAKVYEYLLAHNMRNQGLNLAFVVDEAKQLFAVYQEMQEASGMPESGDQVAKARFLGLSTIAADQEATKLTESLKANTDTKILLPTNNRKQLDSIAEAMHLTDLQKRYVQNLKPGQAIVQHGSNSPVVVDLRNHNLDNYIDDNELKDHQEEKWDDLEYTRRQAVELDFDDTEESKDSDLGKYL
jgi:hypothetical protein